MESRFFSETWRIYINGFSVIACYSIILFLLPLLRLIGSPDESIIGAVIVFLIFIALATLFNIAMFWCGIMISSVINRTFQEPFSARGLSIFSAVLGMFPFHLAFALIYRYGTRLPGWSIELGMSIGGILVGMGCSLRARKLTVPIFNDHVLVGKRSLPKFQFRTRQMLALIFWLSLILMLIQVFPPFLNMSAIILGGTFFCLGITLLIEQIRKLKPVGID